MKLKIALTILALLMSMTALGYAFDRALDIEFPSHQVK